MSVSKFVLVAYLMLMCISCDIAAAATGACPESKRRYPGDCRLFYRCVLLPVPADTARWPGIAHAHVWVPTRCTAGLVFEPALKQCTRPDPDWDCRNDDQLISALKYANTSEQPEEDITEDEHISAAEADDLNMVIPHIVQITSNNNYIDEEAEVVTDNIVSSTPRPSSYQAAITRSPHTPVTDVNGPSVDQIATQMDRIAELAHNLKAVDHTVSPGVLSRTTSRPKSNVDSVTHSMATPVTITHSQIPSPAGLHVIVNNPPVNHAHFGTDPHYELNLMPIQLNRVTGHLVPTKQVPVPLTAQQHETNLNFFGPSVLKHIVEQSAHRVPALAIHQQDTERLVSALFNKYLANKSFVKKNVNGNPIYSPSYAPAIQMPQRFYSVSMNQQASATDYNSPVMLRIKNGEIGTPTRPLPCVSGVRLPNATDCRRYYMCNTTTSAVHPYKCPPYTAFDKVRRMCDVAQYARCVNPNDSVTNLDNMNNVGELVRVQLPPEEACDSRDKLPDPSSHRNYFLCVRSHDGRWTRHQMTCPGLLIYCPTRNFCSPKSSCYQ